MKDEGALDHALANPARVWTVPNAVPHLGSKNEGLELGFDVGK